MIQPVLFRECASVALSHVGHNPLHASVVLFVKVRSKAGVQIHDYRVHACGVPFLVQAVKHAVAQDASDILAKALGDCPDIH
jgi:hypothetical protein